MVDSDLESSMASDLSIMSGSNYDILALKEDAWKGSHSLGSWGSLIASRYTRTGLKGP